MTSNYDITAIVPLGGGGTRLYPLTVNTPKHLIPIANRALFHAAAEHWASQGVKTFIFGVTGFDNRVQSYQFFGHGGRFKSFAPSGEVDFYYANYEDRDYRDDKKGSADVFLWSLDKYRGIMGNNHALLINGDNLSNTSLEDFYESHRRRKALLTIAVKGLELDDPLLRGFGTVAFDDKTMRVSDFVEKSSSPLSRYANTAICLFSPEIREVLRSREVSDGLDEIRKAKGRLDVGNDLIPLLTKLGADVYAHPLNGSWSDVGTPHSYRTTTNDILHGEYPHIRLGGYERLGNAMVHRTTRKLMGDKLRRVTFEGKCIVGSNVEIGKNTVIKNSAIGANSYIGNDVIVDGVTTLFPFARVENNARLSNCVVGYNTTVGERSSVDAGAVLGDDLYIPADFQIGVDWRVAKAEYKDRVRGAGYTIVEDIKDLDAFLFK